MKWKNLALFIMCASMMQSSCIAGEKFHPLTSETTPQGSWQPLTNQPTFVYGVNSQHLLTDGTIMVNVNNPFIVSPFPPFLAPSQTSEIWLLQPDAYGSYVNGTWKQVASLPDGYAPAGYASAVLPDSRILFMGGAYIGSQLVYYGAGAIYDSLANTWTQVAAPSFFNSLYNPPPYTPPSYTPPFFPPEYLTTGNASSVVLNDGTFMLMNSSSYQSAFFDAQTLTWTETGLDANGNQTKRDPMRDEGWTLLPNGKVLTVEVNDWTFLPNYPSGHFPSTLTMSEIYNPETGTWSTLSGSTVVPLADSDPNAPFNFNESNPKVGVTYTVGPAILRSNRSVIQFGGMFYNAIFNYRKNIWTPTSGFPNSSLSAQTAQATSASLLRNGNVLLTTSPGQSIPGTNIFEFTLGDNQFVQQQSFPNASKDLATYVALLVLPTGQVMMTDFSNDVEIYTPGNTSYNCKWAPKIKEYPSLVVAGQTYTIAGIRFNGMSQANATIANYQAATNFPLVRITNKQSGQVFYCRTHDFSFMGVASNRTVLTYFDVPANIEPGESTIEVVANGIPSKPKYISVQ